MDSRARGRICKKCRPRGNTIAGLLCRIKARILGIKDCQRGGSCLRILSLAAAELSVLANPHTINSVDSTKTKDFQGAIAGTPEAEATAVTRKDLDKAAALKTQATTASPTKNAAVGGHSETNDFHDHSENSASQDRKPSDGTPRVVLSPKARKLYDAALAEYRTKHAAQQGQDDASSRPRTTASVRLPHNFDWAAWDARVQRHWEERALAQETRRNTRYNKRLG